MTVNTARTKLVIKELETPGLAIVPFALRLPPSFFQQPNLGGNGDAHDHHHHDDESLLLPPPPQPQMMDPTMFLPDTVGIVGTITIMRNAVMIWFGWGNLEFDDHDGDTTKPSSSPTTSGECASVCFVSLFCLRLETRTTKIQYDGVCVTHVH